MKRTTHGRVLDVRLKEAEKKIADLLRELEDIRRKIDHLPDPVERTVLDIQFRRLVDAFVGGGGTPRAGEANPLDDLKVTNNE
jgi:hypothetical protein